MSTEKPTKPAGGKNEGASPAQPVAKTKLAKAPESRGTPAPAPVAPVPPLFRPVDWITLGLTFLVVFAGYLYTLAPDVTLEDSGELAVASYYAGVPHPPGYPVWTIYTWLFTELLPVSNIAYRVAVSSAFAGALACGLIGLMVSRGSSMMIESLESLRNIDRRWENYICLFTGFVAALVMGFNGFMWSQSVIVEVYSLSVLSLTAVLVFLLRWTYAPNQNRYLYLAFFMFGICFTNHQTLILAAMGIQVAIIFAKPKLGRDLMLGNVLLFVGGLILKARGCLSTFDSPPGQINMVYAIFLMVGLASLVAYVWLLFKTETYYFVRDGLFLAFFVALAVVYANGKESLIWQQEHRATVVFMKLMVFMAVVALGIHAFLKLEQYKQIWVVLLGGALFFVGASLYLFMPITSMTNPPLNWGYPRTEDGFWHAFTRGQYEKTNPTNIFTNPLRFIRQMWDYTGGMVNEFTFVYLVIGLVPLAFLKKMQKRERAWVIGLTAIYLCLAVLLMIMLNPGTDRQSRELNRVFFTSSHVVVSMFIGYGLAILAALLLTDYQRWRMPLLFGVGAATGIALYVVLGTFGDTEKTVIDPESWFYDWMAIPNKSPLVRFTAVYSLVLAVLGLITLGVFRARVCMPLVLAVFALMPIKSILSHWEDNEQRGHLFGYWFGHDMFTPPFKNAKGEWSYDAKERAELLKAGKLVYPEMARDAVLFGGTDPGRFNPTYMIFCESFIDAKYKPRDPVFDRRDVYLITQNALADGTYLNYIRAHYNRSAQVDPPFFQELFRSTADVQQNRTNLLAKMMRPVDAFFLNLGDRVEKRRRVGSSYFQPEHFTDLAGLARKIQTGGEPAGVSKYLLAQLSAQTQSLLGTPGPALAKALAADLNRVLEGGILYDSNRFAGVTLKETTKAFIAQQPKSHTRIRLNRLLLEEAYPKEIAPSLGGVYPDREIHTPSVEDSQRCFSEYLDDVQRRMQSGQIRPGEDVRIEGGRVQVSGQVAVMSINALLAKVIFDKNPTHEFYVEESFPLQWMYPYLEPYGIIMRINRTPMPDLTERQLELDHEFWAHYSERLIGNWITYDTPISNICKFAEDVYLHRDYSKFTGDRKFIRDDNAQKAFSKLRSSIAGVYAWRLSNSADTPPEYRPKTPAQRRRLMKEAEFAFKQALAFCPYSPEAVFRYINLLLANLHENPARIDDALLIAETCRKLDPGNPQVADLVNRLREIRKANENLLRVSELEKNFLVNPTVSNAFSLAQVYLLANDTNKAVNALATSLMQPSLNTNELAALATAFMQLNQVPLLEQTLLRMSKVASNTAEVFYDLAGVQALQGKNTEALTHLQRAMELNQQARATNPNTKNFREEILGDGRFHNLRSHPDFLKIISGK
ncbi:DUF2723 domain-containing protein [Fontisphaera persica]|uniref:DUF2723 domain-containing protein n=1 Tax=Fontisphaera persica TaxID=2974023 RepID=UPI0024C0A170|nr:DUF2723 domain-containing protein [Fontisphaera persica]WCJ58303.1 DUF2723 domain-containing protein [Fontisphaera persica]